MTLPITSYNFSSLLYLYLIVLVIIFFLIITSTTPFHFQLVTLSFELNCFFTKSNFYGVSYFVKPQILTFLLPFELFFVVWQPKIVRKQVSLGVTCWTWNSWNVFAYQNTITLYINKMYVRFLNIIQIWISNNFIQ